MIRRLKFLSVLFLVLRFSEGGNEKPCASRSYQYSSVVCVCNATYCDTIPHPQSLPRGQYLSYTSTESGLRFKIEQGDFQISENEADYTVIHIDSSETYQTILGWGGAFTDATGININSLSFEVANFLLRSYFSKDGLEYNLCRVPIGGTDFSTHGYSYNDGDIDTQLVNFKLAPEDHKYKIPTIKAAQNITDGKLELFASAWTAPKWMKHNGKYTGPDVLKKSMYQPWANYFLKFLKAYKAEGLNFWGITTGNEPVTGLIPSRINSVGWLPWQMRKWIAENLGPTIRNSEFSSVKIIAIDDQAFFYPWYIDMLFENEKVKQYVDGFGLHWYWNWLFPASLFTATHEKHPDKFILATEASEGEGPFVEHVKLGDWKRAQSYATDIIKDLNNWVAGWIDWNMALDLKGGPTYINNNLDSPIIVNATSGEFYKQPMYYALGHFTKFIPRGSKRVSVNLSSENIDVVAFSRPDNGIAVVIMNKNTQEVPIKLQGEFSKEIVNTVPAKSITTFLYW